MACSLKNLKGVLPAREKHVAHLSGLHQAIVDVNKVVRLLLCRRMSKQRFSIPIMAIEDLLKRYADVFRF